MKPTLFPFTDYKLYITVNKCHRRVPQCHAPSLGIKWAGPGFCNLENLSKIFFCPIVYSSPVPTAELEFLKSPWGLGTEEEEGYHTGPPGYIGWRNSFLGIDSGAPYTYKNTSSGYIDWRNQFLGPLNVNKFGLRHYFW
jgi:hypothetical protein